MCLKELKGCLCDWSSANERERAEEGVRVGAGGRRAGPRSHKPWTAAARRTGTREYVL